ncbi:Uma2 family endonuclease [Capnocytophaga genosp. AHN8471]|uniref:Uma2 family endonuclease n=1 Tax=Capnocytophaga genosp. AHN8471 TaxID=327574 RepID=UPI0019344D77|nr:Uma2 family endonuclease [Capnocytophaga genosp. AHN8471]MBM0659046.1 Uma2 family endonuclease [Capnocytophaga genosp. AHN8471]
MTITNINQLDPINGLYTYAEYLLWQFEERVELLKGKLFKMSAPSIDHQRVSRKLSTKIDNYLEGKRCEVFSVPFDVVLKNPNGEDNTVLQPDLCVVCDPEKLADGKRCYGAPDWVLEIVSPSNVEKELSKKMHIYEEAGVAEYWVLRPEEKELDIFVLQDNGYIGLKPRFAGEVVSPQKFPDLQINLSEIFSS